MASLVYLLFSYVYHFAKAVPKRMKQLKWTDAANFA